MNSEDNVRYSRRRAAWWCILLALFFIGLIYLRSDSLGVGVKSGPGNRVRRAPAATHVSSVENGGTAEEKAPRNVCLLKVVDAVSQAAIADARVACRKRGIEGNTTIELDDDGCFVFPAAGVYFVQIRAPGYVALCGALTVKDPLNTVCMEQSGALKAAFVDEFGRGVEGIDAGLLIPAEAMRVAHQGGLELLVARGNPKMRSSSDGVALWDSLPPACGYKLENLSGKDIEFPESMTAKSMEFVGDKIVSRSSASENSRVSAGFEIKAGETHCVTMLVHSMSRVSGSVVDAAGIPVPGAAVLLFHRDAHLAPSGRFGAVEFNHQQTQRTGRDGSFAFQGVRPGSKMLLVKWRKSDHDETVHLYFTRLGFELLPGESKGLGLMRPDAGQDVSGEMTTVDSMGVKVGGAQLEKLLGKPEAELKALIHVHGGAKGHRLGDPPLATNFEVGVNVPFILHGIPDGDLHVVVGSSGWPAPTECSVKWPPCADYYGGPPANGIHLPITIYRNTKARFVLLYPAHVPPFDCDIFLVPDASMKYHPLQPTVNIRTDSDENRKEDGKAAGEVYVPPGRYRAYARPRFGKGSTSPNYFAEQDVNIGQSDRNEVRLVLQPGANVRGRLIGPDGSPLANDDFRFVIDSYDTEMPYHLCRTDAKGEFTLSGLAPNRKYTTYKLSSGYFSFTSGNPGETTEPEMRPDKK